jgi:hypothetical protein
MAGAARFFGKIVGGIVVMGLCAVGIQVLQSTMKEIGKVVVQMVSMLFNAYRNRNK